MLPTRSGKREFMETDTIQRVLRARYGGVEASDVLVQFARIERERPDALTWMQNGKFFEVYGDAAGTGALMHLLHVLSKVFPLTGALLAQYLIDMVSDIFVGNDVV